MYPSSKELEKLSGYFKRYSPFWFEWSHYKYNRLSESDIYIINVFRDKDFRITHDDLLMFYFKRKVILGITEKLKLSYPEFQNWIILKFQVSLVCMISSLKFDNLLNVSDGYLSKKDNLRIDALLIRDIDNLPLEKVIRNIFIQMGVTSLKDIIDNFSEKDFKQIDVFEKLIAFISEIEKEKVC